MSKQKKLKHPKRKDYKTSEEYWKAMEAYTAARNAVPSKGLTKKQTKRVTSLAHDFVRSVRTNWDDLSPAEKLKERKRIERRDKDIKKKKK